MSFVDDSLMGTSPARSTKAGSKSAAQFAVGAAGKNGAFESAIADAGKKKPTIALSGAKDAAASPEPTIEPDGKDVVKIDTDDAPDQKSRAKNGSILSAVDAPDPQSRVKNDTILSTADAPDPKNSIKNDRILSTDNQGNAARAKEPPTSLPLPNLALKDQNLALKEKSVSAPQEDRSTSLALLNRLISTKDTAASVVTTETEVLPDQEVVKLASAMVAGDHPVDPEIEFLPSLGKIAELVKDGKLVKSVEGSKPGSVDSRQARLNDDDDETAVVAESVETGGVSQLLALLGAPKDLPAAASTDVPTTPTELISEFQALADRAGKTRSDNRQANGTGATRQSALAADANAVANATASGTDQTFRFARADGKGQSVSMRINTEGDKPSARIDATGTKADAPSSAKAEAVTVLESRRYLGIAANTNSQAVTAAVTGSTEWARAMQPSSGLSSPEAASAAGKVVNTLKIQMHPIDLGTVTATLRLKDDELHVDLKVESGEAFRQLSDDQNAMVKALRSQGFAVDQINITFNAPSDAGTGNAGSQQPQSQAGQQGRDASGDGAAQGRGRNDNSSQQQSGERWTGNDGTDEASAVSERGGADHTYM